MLIKHSKKAGIAQLVEQRTENPRVGSSNLPPGINPNPFYNPIETSRGNPFRFFRLDIFLLRRSPRLREISPKASALLCALLTTINILLLEYQNCTN